DVSDGINARCARIQPVCHPCAIGGGFPHPPRPARLGKTLNLCGLGRTICTPASVNYGLGLITNQSRGVKCERWRTTCPPRSRRYCVFCSRAEQGESGGGGDVRNLIVAARPV